MTRPGALGVTAVVALLSGGLVAAQAFNMRPGQWQWVINMNGTAMGDMSKLPPEMAKKIAAELNKPHTVTDCLTPEEVKKGWNGAYGDDEDDDCRVTSRKVTGNAIDVVRACTGDQPRTETAHFEMASPESMRGSVTITGGRTGTMTMTGKWIPGTCKD